MGQKASKKPNTGNIDGVRLEALNKLPPDVMWHARLCAQHPNKWEYDGDEELGYYFKEFPPQSTDYNHALNLLKQLGGETLPLKRILGVYNPALTSRFSNNRLLLEEKRNATPWNSQWKDDPNSGSRELREVVHSQYTQKVNSYAWNSALKVPILAAVHGTGLPIAQSICKTGFAALATVDSGFFGKGIYFTSSSMYSLPYATYHSQPALIISYIVPGNIYPTVEQHKGPETLLGKPLRSPGYHSHYVVTQKDGFAVSPEKSQKPFYDEIVIPTEAQVLPAFIIELDNSPQAQLKTQNDAYEREISQNNNQ